MAIQLSQIIDRFSELLKFDHGDANVVVDGLQTPKLSSPNEIIFVTDFKHLADAKEGKSKIWVIHHSLAKELADAPVTLVVSPNPYLAMALVGKEFFPSQPGIVPVDGIQIHPTAVISKTARLGNQVKIGPGAVISDGCDIAEGAMIGANSVLEPFVKIGPRTRIHPLVFIGHSCEIGAECDVKPHTTIGGEGFGFAHDDKGRHHRITHYGRVIVEDRVHIGSNVQIDRGTFEDSRIGEGTKIDNHCHFGHNIRIGRHSIMVGGTLIAGSVNVGSHCVFAGRVSISGHLDICDNVQLMATTGIGKSIDKPGQYGGVPVQDAKDVLKTRAVLLKLPEMRKQILRILKKLDLEE